MHSWTIIIVAVVELWFNDSVNNNAETGPKAVDGMANSVDPDQTAPQGAV